MKFTMSKKKMIIYAIFAFVAVLAFWIGGYTFFINSEDWVAARSVIKKTEEVTAQVTWNAATSQMQIWATSSTGSGTSGLVTYDGAFALSTALTILDEMVASVHLLDIVEVKNSTFTDLTGFDSP